MAELLNYIRWLSGHQALRELSFAYHQERFSEVFLTI